jgi:hypothetical protein
MWYQNGEFTTDPFDVMPENFKNRLITEETPDAPGIYKWELVDVADEFDVSDLYDKKKTDNTYSFPSKKIFNTIFTTTLSPSESSDIMWFNGITTDRVYNDSGQFDISKQFENESYNRYIVYGWQYLDRVKAFLAPPLFIFNKFVPVLNNDFAIINDTALNINYNVNITGDQNNYKKNLTVHGSVISDLITTDTLYADKIDTVNTENDIVTTAGIKAGFINNDKALFDVNAEGNVVCGDIDATKLNVNLVKVQDDTNIDVVDEHGFSSTGNAGITIEPNYSFVKSKIVGNTAIDIHPIVPGDTDAVKGIKILTNTQKHIIYKGNGGSSVNSTNYNITNLNIDKPSIKFSLNTNEEPSITIGHDNLSHELEIYSNNDFVSVSENNIDFSNNFSFDEKSFLNNIFPKNESIFAIRATPPGINDQPVGSRDKSARLTCGPTLFTVNIPISTGLCGLDVNNNTFVKQELLTKYNDYQCITIPVDSTYVMFVGVEGTRSIVNGNIVSYPTINSDSYFRLLYTIGYYDKNNKWKDLLTYDTSEGNIIYERSEWLTTSTGEWYGYYDNGDTAPKENGLINRWQKWFLNIPKIKISGAKYKQLISNINDKAKNFSDWQSETPTLCIKVKTSLYIHAQPSNPAYYNITSVNFKGIRLDSTASGSDIVLSTRGAWHSTNPILPSTIVPIEEGEWNSLRYSIIPSYYIATSEDDAVRPELLINRHGLLLTDSGNVAAGIGYDDKDYKIFYKYNGQQMQQASIFDLIALTNLNASMITYGV